MNMTKVLPDADCALNILNAASGEIPGSIDHITIIRNVPAWEGEVEIRLSPCRPHASLLFVMNAQLSGKHGVYEKGFLELLKGKSSLLGANLLIVECAQAGMTGKFLCTVYGYRKP